MNAKITALVKDILKTVEVFKDNLSVIKRNLNIMLVES